MSHSYKHTPVYKIKSTYHKRCANKRLRRKSQRNYCDAVNGKSNRYRREYSQYDVCDYRFWGEPIWREESWRNLRGEPELWQKCYKRK